MTESNAKNKKISWQKYGFAVAFLLVAVLLAFFLKDTILELRRLTKNHDEDGIRTFMQSRGAWGYLTVILVEALEMIVVCIPAELIQMPAGISFSFPIAILLCDVGVMLGASAIYFLVHTFQVKPPLFEKKEKKVEEIEKSSGGVRTQILMYFLFVTPIIPFGAICYYCSNKNICFGKYLFTCATGVLPSIVTSIIMGTGVRYFIANSLSLWKLILLLVVLGAALFVGMFLIGRKFIYKNHEKNTPYSFWYKPFLFVFGSFVKLHSKPVYREDELYERFLDIEGPCLIFCNHQSVYDIYHTMKFLYPVRPALVGNRYYTRIPLTRFAMRSLGYIPKRMFTAEIEPIKKIIAAVKNGTSVFIYPEARLSLDGTTNPIAEGTGALAKRLGIPVVILNVNGDFAAYSKFHTAEGRVPVQVRIKKIVTPDELEAQDAETINRVIQDGIDADEYAYLQSVTIRGKKLASGSEKVIYKCPACGCDFTVRAEGNRLVCDCGFAVAFDTHYRFEPNPYGFSCLSDAYRHIKALEKEEIRKVGENYRFAVDVNVKVLSFESKKQDLTGAGTVTLSPDGIAFEGTIDGEKQTFSRGFPELPCLAFSVDDEFEFYRQNKLHYFYPVENKRACTKISTVYDVLYEQCEEKRKHAARQTASVS